MKGRAVRNLEDLAILRQQKKCVIGNAGWCRKPRPAVFVMNMIASCVRQGIMMGMGEYVKGEKDE